MVQDASFFCCQSKQDRTLAFLFTGLSAEMPPIDPGNSQNGAQEPDGVKMAEQSPVLESKFGETRLSEDSDKNGFIKHETCDMLRPKIGILSSEIGFLPTASLTTAAAKEPRDCRKPHNVDEFCTPAKTQNHENI